MYNAVPIITLCILFKARKSSGYCGHGCTDLKIQFSGQVKYTMQKVKRAQDGRNVAINAKYKAAMRTLPDN